MDLIKQNHTTISVIFHGSNLVCQVIAIRMSHVVYQIPVSLK